MISHWDLAQVTAPATGFSYPLALTTLTAEIALGTLSWAGFNAESRCNREDGKDTALAESGFQTGKVIPATAKLIESVLEERAEDEPVKDTLIRFNVSPALDEVVAAAALSGSPSDHEGRLIRAWTFVAYATVVVMVAGLATMLDPITNKNLIPSVWGTIALAVMSGAGALVAVALGFVRHYKRLLARAIRAGITAADGS